MRECERAEFSYKKHYLVSDKNYLVSDKDYVAIGYPNNTHPENGLLLRADLHTLFDLDLLGISPKNLKLFFHPKIQIAGYKEWHSKKLLCSTSLKPSKLALLHRWVKFYKRYYCEL
ncbi:HNH endonuclease [Dulcicalothrix desertica]|uniref:HNH endonuclease n=1 Tax=Dulcicalothrix desertica TaxID=32056 RepID=UPI000F8F3213